MQLKYKANGNYARVGDLINYRGCRFTLKEIIPPSALNKFKGMVWLTRCSDAEELNCEWVPEADEKPVKVLSTRTPLDKDFYAARWGKPAQEETGSPCTPFEDHELLPHADIIRAVLDGKAVRRQYSGSGTGPAQYVAYSTDAVGQRDAIQAILSSPVSEWSIVPPTATSYIPVWGEARGLFSGASYALRSAAVSQRVGGKPPAIILVVTLDENLKVVDSHTEAP